MTSTALLEEIVNTCLHADSRKLLALLPDACVDTILTDPPYNIKYRSNRRRERFNRVSGDDSLAWAHDYFPEAFRVLANDRFAFIFIDWRSYPAIVEIVKQAGFTIRGIITWYKLNHGSGNLTGGLAPCTEWIMCLAKGNPVWPTAQGRLRDHLPCARIDGTYRIHPTQKPVALLRKIIEHATLPGDLVLDTFAGSFATFAACIEANDADGDTEHRNFIGCELKREWFDRAGILPESNQLDLL